MALLRQQDRRAVTWLYESYAPALYNIILKTVWKKEPAAEVLQDTFVKICRNIDQYDPEKGRLFTWMARIARHAAIDKLRSGQFKRGEKTEALPDFVSNDARYSESSRVTDPALQQVLEQLAPRDRRIIDLLYFQGYSQSEAGKAMDIPLGTIKTRVRKAISQLRSILKKEKHLIDLFMIIICMLIGY